MRCDAMQRAFPPPPPPIHTDTTPALLTWRPRRPCLCPPTPGPPAPSAPRKTRLWGARPPPPPLPPCPWWWRGRGRKGAAARRSVPPGCGQGRRARGTVLKKGGGRGSQGLFARTRRMGPDERTHSHTRAPPTHRHFLPHLVQDQAVLLREGVVALKQGRAVPALAQKQRLLPARVPRGERREVKGAAVDEPVVGMMIARKVSLGIVFFPLSGSPRQEVLCWPCIHPSIDMGHVRTTNGRGPTPPPPPSPPSSPLSPLLLLLLPLLPGCCCCRRCPRSAGDDA